MDAAQQNVLVGDFVALASRTDISGGNGFPAPVRRTRLARGHGGTRAPRSAQEQSGARAATQGMLDDHSRAMAALHARNEPHLLLWRLAARRATHRPANEPNRRNAMAAAAPLLRNTQKNGGFMNERSKRGKFRIRDFLFWSAAMLIATVNVMGVVIFSDIAAIPARSSVASAHIELKPPAPAGCPIMVDADSPSASSAASYGTRQDTRIGDAAFRGSLQ